MSGVRCQDSEDRGQRTEVRGLRSEDRSQETEVRSQKTENRGPAFALRLRRCRQETEWGMQSIVQGMGHNATKNPESIFVGRDTVPAGFGSSPLSRLQRDRHRGEVILLVGNGSGNLQLLHQRLGGTGEGPYTYGDLFIYTIPDQGPVKVKKSRYGS